MLPTLFMPGLAASRACSMIGAAAMMGGIYYFLRLSRRVVDHLVVNMVDVGEETGELDTMLYKVADTYDAEVAVITESLTKLLEPLLVIVPGRCGGFYCDFVVHAAGQLDSKPVGIATAERRTGFPARPSPNTEHTRDGLLPS